MKKPTDFGSIKINNTSLQKIEHQRWYADAR